MFTNTKANKRVKLILTILLSLAALIAVFHLIPRPKSVPRNGFLVGSGNRPLLIAHGGGNLEFPDNTLEAFYHAYSLDSRVMMETDVHMTRDGVVILSHDGTFDRKTDVSGRVADWNYRDLVSQEADFNYHSQTSNGARVNSVPTPFKNYEGHTVTPLDVAYPVGVVPRHESKFLVTTLEELITAFPDNTVNVEIKPSGDNGLRTLETVIAMLDRLNAYNRVVLASFHKEIYEKIKEYHAENPAIQFSPNGDGIIMLYLTHWIGLDFLYNEPVSVLQIPTREGVMPLDGRKFINAAHRHNIAMHYWTINDEDEMRDLAERGADGIMSDRPTLLKEVLDDLYGLGI